MMNEIASAASEGSIVVKESVIEEYLDSMVNMHLLNRTYEQEKHIRLIKMCT